MLPAEWAATHAARILVFSYGMHEYRDDRLKQWLLEVEDWLWDRAALRLAREKYLTPEQIIEAERIESQDV